MYIHHVHKKPLLTVVAIAIATAALIVGSFATMARASSIVGVTSNIADVPGGDSLILTVTAQNDGDVHELEIDHSLYNVLQEFSVYADEADPYGGDGALFATAGVNVTYSAANSQWVIDFGQTVTDVIRDNGGKINFHLVLRDANHNILWGSMDLPAPDSTFSFDTVAGTGDSLVPPVVDEGESSDEVVVPGVPNTSVVGL